MKPNEFSALVNALREVNTTYGHTQQLRAHIAKTLREHGIMCMNYPDQVRVSVRAINDTEQL